MTNSTRTGPTGWSSDPRGEVERLCRRCVGAAAVDGGGVSVVTGDLGHRGTVCATDGVAAGIEEAQFLLGEGPCVDAASAHAPVLVSDLADPHEGVQSRWPGFLDAAESSGVRAVFAFPLRIGAISLGAMDLYRSTPGPLTSEQIRATLLAADAVALALLDGSTGTAGDEQPAWHRTAARPVVHNAAGMITVQLGVSIEQALVRLRATAYARGQSIDDVARDVVSGRIRLPEEDA
jgi:hypothetical protein